MRRLRSPSWPVTRTCSGASKPSASSEAGMSCATPSVTRIAAPTRSGGVSLSAERSAANRLRAAIVGIAAAGLDEAGLDVVERGEALFQFGARFAPSGAAVRRSGWRRIVDDDRDDVLERAAVLAHQRGIEQRQPQQRRARARAAPRRAGAATASARSARARARPAPRGREAAAAARKRSTTRSMRKPFQEVLGVDLVGLVIAGQRVHHEIDAAAQRQFALARAAGNERIERPAARRRPPRPRRDRWR